MTVQVAEPATQQQESAEGEQVGVDDPSEVWEKCRSERIDGSATLTIVVSSTIIRLPPQSTISASQRLRVSIVVMRRSFRACRSREVDRS
jgi:hypothetical protein